MKRLQLRAVTKELRQMSQFLELERGEGYHYFILDNGTDVYETESVMVPFLNQMTMAQWLEAGADFLAKHKDRL